MQKPFFARTLEKITHIPAIWAITGVWLLILASIYIYQTAHGISLPDMLLSLFVFFEENPSAPLLYIVVYTLQPFAFLPSTIFTVVAGSIFGFWPALIYTLIGANLSATAVYITGRLLARPLPEIPQRFARFVQPLRKQPFETILFMRLAYFPFDVVNMVCGILKLRYMPFVVATAIGTVPGIATLTSLGTSISFRDLLTNGVSLSAINPLSLLYAAILFVISVVLARVFKTWQARRSTAPKNLP